ncbi:HTTM domain-containing protein [Cyclobacterium jeungdonense]|uniref:HTTM domain-containing protein n=1 Tax=Cyclobacterium jeungdonense TaxID=708087 RepID=A0ABT8C7X9_9BACT|nr:HTTM domain-containing protein [Cyclobacterium jeungdonense]MDN3688506.1 HTTM domain-containing protein [Cyclobacterium jeungdonense]
MLKSTFLSNLLASIRIEALSTTLRERVRATPFSVFRGVFGLLMAVGTARFMWLGWIEDHYTTPIVHFHYWGFEWIEPFSTGTLYVLHWLMLLAAFGVMLGTRWLYRLSAVTLFLTFTYTELIDLTYYLNHYYYVSIVCAFLCIVPSPPPIWDTEARVPRWVLVIFKLQIAIVYIYAGLAKINYDWLILALPLKIWLPAHDNIPILGPLFTWSVTPYIFSWFGMLYDCLIVFFLLYRRTRVWAYVTVIIFHSLTGLLFQIGIFPLVMMGGTLIFFDFGTRKSPATLPKGPPKTKERILAAVLLIHFTFQLLFPWRYLLYEGNVSWTEQGYRFGWRVMLMEKAGTATFYVKDSQTGREGVVDNREFLNPHQEKQMAMQPDMILQFAHFLGAYYAEKGVHSPQVRAEVYVTLNGRPSQLLIDPTVNLMKETDSFGPKKWIVPYEKDAKNAL